MKLYRVKNEHIDNWTNDCVENLIVSGSEIKRLSAEWCEPERSLKAQVEPIRRESVKVERFHIGEYYVDVEEKVDPVCGLMWDAWISKGRYGVKSYIKGVIADQTRAKEPHIITHDEAIELIFTQFDIDVQCFEDDVEALERED